MWQYMSQSYAVKFLRFYNFKRIDGGYDDGCYTWDIYGRSDSDITLHYGRSAYHRIYMLSMP
jgi:hypothetical protein